LIDSSIFKNLLVVGKMDINFTVKFDDKFVINKLEMSDKKKIMRKGRKRMRSWRWLIRRRTNIKSPYLRTNIYSLSKLIDNYRRILVIHYY